MVISGDKTCFFLIRFKHFENYPLAYIFFKNEDQNVTWNMALYFMFPRYDMKIIVLNAYLNVNVRGLWVMGKVRTEKSE